MRKLLLLATFALVASLIFATAVAAQEDTPPEEKMEAQGMQGEEDPGMLAPSQVAETEEALGEPEVLETPFEEALEEPIEEAIGADQPEPKAEEAFEEKAQEKAEKAGLVSEAQTEGGKVKVDTTIPAPAYAPLPKSGGPAAGSVLLPAAALLLGAGLLTYAILRRR